MIHRHLLHISIPLVVNILFSWTLLPFVIPTFGVYSFSMLFEVLLWQSIGMVGWPFALLGMVVSIPFGAELTSIASFVFIFLYPAIQFLLIRCVFSKTLRRLDLLLLHLLVIISFVVVWYYVFNGYDFMVG